ncbi:MAG: hypothetical protein P8X42_04525 [Calditrichaceae bacterium]
MYIRYFLIVAVFFCAGLKAQAPDSVKVDANIQLKTYLQQNEVPQNREVVYHLELIWNGELNRYNISNIGDPVVSNLKLRGSGSSNQYFIDKSGQPKSVKQVTYYFKPVEMGMAYIDGVTIQYEDNLTGQSETLSAQRLGVKITEPLPDPNAGMDFGLVIILTLAIIFVLVVIYFLFRYIRQRKINAEEMESQPLTLEEKYLQLLNESVELSSDKRNETLNSIAKLLNSYFSEKFNLPGTPDFIQVKGELQKLDISEELIEKIEKLYERDNLSKFAREQISENELHLFYDTVEQVIRKLEVNKPLEENN